MNINVRVERQYGNLRRYPTDQRIAAALQMLTRRSTLIDSDITALLALGHTISETEEHRTAES